MASTPKTISQPAPSTVTTPDYVSPPVKIASTQAGFRRAGQLFGPTASIFPAGTFTALQMAQLKAEPKLVVVELDPKTGKAAPEFDPAKTEGQLASHLAADPAGLTTMLARLGFVPKAAPAPAPAPAPALAATPTPVPVAPPTPPAAPAPTAEGAAA